MTDKLPEQVIAARARVLLKRPFFAGHLLTKNELVYNPEVETARTDGHTHEVGKWFCGLPVEQQVFVLCHETLHDILGHHLRAKMYTRRGFGPDMKPFSKKRYDKAADYVINAILRDDGVGDMPRNGLWSSRFTSQHTLDEVYEMLPEEQEEDEQTPGHGGFDEHGEPSDGDGEATSPKTEEEINEIVRDRCKAAEAAAKAIGAELGSALRRVIGTVIEPQVAWDEECRQFCTSIPRGSDTSWRRVNRRRLCAPPFLPYPGQDGHEIDCMVIAPDASGSIGPGELALFLSEMRSIYEVLRPRECWVLWWDTAVQAIEITSAADVEELQPYGGGGTVYACVPEWLAKNAVEPNVVICLTDGFVTWPSEDRIHWPHLTVSTTDCAAPFGKTVHMRAG